MELFMHNVADASCLADYPNVRVLALHLQTIPRAVGLAQMQQLQRLSMTECSLESIRGLESCVQLLHLDVSMNRIQLMDRRVLSKLPCLRSLWMSENSISLIEGLEHLPKLHTLWLARNSIRFLYDSLDRCTGLTELNLAATEMDNLKEISNLSRLRSLSSLVLSDPHFGESPVCSLCNYETYVLSRLQQLQRLDTLVVSDEMRHLAEVTFTKKKMYYNMRIKMLKRKTSKVVRVVGEVRQVVVSQLNHDRNPLVRQLKGVQRELHELGACVPSSAAEPSGAAEPSSASDPPQELVRLQERSALLERSVARSAAEISSTEVAAAEATRAICESSQLSICRLMLELETGGNIRFEEGKPSDIWFSSCVALVHSRFVAAEYAELGVTGMRVTRVTRVHNRHQRSRFEGRLDSMVNTGHLSGTTTSSTGYKRSLEYLFYAERRDGELTGILEEGFHSVDEYVSACGHAAVPLSNSVSLCDLGRLKHALGNAAPAQLPAALSGKLLVTQAFLARCTEERVPAAGADASAQPVPLCQADYSSYSSIFRICGSGGKQRQWFCFEPELVLPEYLVEFEYETASTNLGRELSVSQMLRMGRSIGVLDGCGVEGTSAPTEAEAVDLAHMMRPLVRFALQCTASKSSSDHPNDEELLDAPCVKQGEKSARIDRISPKLLEEHAQMRSASIKQLRRLDLHGNAIRVVEGLHVAHSLRELILCFNEIHAMEGLSALHNLRVLDLGFNLIKRIEGVRGLEKLERLELNNNLIYRLEDVAELSEHVPQVATLNLQNNAICQVKGYRKNILRRLGRLTWLDETPVLHEERTVAVESIAGITPALIHAHTSTRQRFNGSLRPERIAEGEGAAMVYGSAEDTGLLGGDAKHSRGFRGRFGSFESDANWWAEVDALELNHQHLRKLHDLERLVNLRRASFSSNELARIEGLDGCAALEELSLEDNRIAKVENLSRLVMLTKLDLGSNKICTIEGLETLTALTQLSLEENEIVHLAGLSQLRALLELYIGSNCISDTREVLQLKPLPKLLILDLSGNPLTEADEYRSHTIYQLRHLRVLDGVGIEDEERSDAKERFMGKLTLEALGEHLGHQLWEGITELDLSRMKMREFEALKHEGFRNLRALSLDFNLVTHVESLPSLPKLKALRLNHNLLQSQPRPSVPNGLQAVGGGLRASVGGLQVVGGGLQAVEGGPQTVGGGLQAVKGGLSSLTALEVLHLAYNQITSVPQLRLHVLDQLRVLHLQGNDIWRLEGLEGLYRLRELVLDQNRIRQLEPESLSSLTSLRTLHLEENGLRSLAHLPPQLQTLALGTNRICDLAELERIDHLSETLTQITLANNPVTRKQHYRLALTQRLSELTLLDDREVTSEERARAQGLFCADAPTPGGNDRQWLKVPLKITSMDFEMVSGLGTHVAAPPLTVAKPLGTNGGHGILKWNLMTVGPAISVAPATSVGPATREDLLFPPHAKRFGGSQRRLEERANSQASLRESRTHGMNRTASIGRH